MSSVMKKTLGVVFLAAILKVVFSGSAETGNQGLDLRAALLVFAAPPALLLIFGKASTEWKQSLLRMREILRFDSNRLHRQLADASIDLGSTRRTAILVALGENHPDSMVRYATDLVLAKHEPETLNRLLSQRVRAEDEHWQEFVSLFAFLAKMAPYFGMLATVIGMVKLLDHLNDFSRISGSMALAMQGTLYGLVAFTLVYAPIQRYLQGFRDRAFKRNLMICKWFVAVGAQTDPVVIRSELESLTLFAPSATPSRLTPARQGSPA